MKRVAIIIPVYNQARYLARCLDSLAAQTCSDFIAIFVDDGSTDDSAAMVERAKGECVLIRQANGGVSAARNRGLDEACRIPGIEAVMFLDPDDRYAPDCVARAMQAHDANPAAIIEWAFATTAGRISSFTASDRLEPSVWTKLYPLVLVADVRFCVASNVAEDLAFNLDVEHRHHPQLVRIAAPLYFYEDNPNSTMRRALTAQDFTRRAAIIEHIVAIFRDDAVARDRVCREEVPELLKQFWRDLKRVEPCEEAAARAAFQSLLRSLKSRGLLHPKRGRFKDIKYYLRFRFMV